MKIEEMNRQLTICQSKANKLRVSIKKAIIREQSLMLVRAKKKAKFRVGDIIRYSPDKAPIFVMTIECYPTGEPSYLGLEIRNGTVTRRIISTQGWGTQEPYYGGPYKENGKGTRRPSHDWIKVGDCEDLKLT